MRFALKPATSTNSCCGRGFRVDTVQVLHRLGIGGKACNRGAFEDFDIKTNLLAVIFGISLAS